MIFKLAEAAERSWRRLDGHNQLPKVILGVKFTAGIEVESQAQTAAARPLPSPRFNDSSGLSWRFQWLAEFVPHDRDFYRALNRGTNAVSGLE